jgi:hypothetical protein
MATEIITHAPTVITLRGGLSDIITTAGDKTAWRFVEFFTSAIRNPNTCEAYARIIVHFLSWFTLDNLVCLA